MAKKYGKSTAQVLIRYCLQRNIVTLAKSSNPVRACLAAWTLRSRCCILLIRARVCCYRCAQERIKENTDVYDFAISAEDMKASAPLLFDDAAFCLLCGSTSRQ